jgi:uncharacterized protein YutE (UPF0331/DUF86 family)
MHLVRIHRLGVPQQSREAFILLQKQGFLSPELSLRMQAMVGFRNIAVHNYQKLNLAVLRSILEQHLTDFRDFSQRMIELS